MTIAQSPSRASVGFTAVTLASGRSLSRTQLLEKRTLDLLIAMPLLGICAVPAIVICLYIRLTSAGPAIFQQLRVGIRGRRFVLFKFRTMFLGDDAPHRKYIRTWIHSGEQARQEDGFFKLSDNARLTRAGRFLRKYSLDELPQLLNVLRGEMSLVGPRPAMDYEIAEYQPWQCARLNVPPGITGLWQVSGRNQLSFERMIELDLEYIQNWSLRRDLKILLHTVPVVLFGTGH